MFASRLFFVISIFSIIFCIQWITGDAKCIHDEIDHKPEFLEVDEQGFGNDLNETDGRTLASIPSSPIRIYTYFDTLTYGTASFRNYIKYQLAPPVIDFYRAALKVKYPLTSPLVLSTSIKTICQAKTPTILQTTGVSTDHFLFFTAENANDQWIAGSSYCYLSTGSKRPLVSRVRFNARWLVEPGNDVLQHEQNTYELLHELMHSFGFSASLFQYFLDANGKVRTGHIKTVYLTGTPRKVIDIPEMTTKLRNYYGCSNLEGAFLEDDGGDGTASSHFERRHFMYEVMTSGAMDKRRVSEFSLSLLEGSGWYIPNYSYAEPFYFGQGQGCNFLRESCSLSSFNFDDFCKVNTARACSPVGYGGGICQSDTRSDGCKINYPAFQLDCESPDAHSYARLPTLQVFGRGSGSRCFEGTLSSSKLSVTPTTFCFKYTCVNSGLTTTLEVTVGKAKLTCLKAGSVTVSGYQGKITCPDPLTFCNTVGKQFCPRNCMGRGKCVNNQCQCYKGYKGTDCGLLA